MSAQAELHDAIRALALSSAPLMALVTAFYDAVPDQASRWGAKQAYLSLGETDVVEDDADCITAGVHTVQIDCWSRVVGSYHCKRIVDALKVALHDKDIELPSYGAGRLSVVMRRVDEDPDGLTMHGVVMVEAYIEEAVL